MFTTETGKAVVDTRGVSGGGAGGAAALPIFWTRICFCSPSAKFSHFLARNGVTTASEHICYISLILDKLFLKFSPPAGLKIFLI